MRRRRHPIYKSKWEGRVADQLREYGFEPDYEADRISYIVPEKKHNYHPDWKISPNIYIESKGIFDTDDRKKMLLVIEQHPTKRFYLLFENAYKRIYKNSKTTYADWCTKNGIEWAHKTIKKEWIDEAIRDRETSRNREC